MLLAPIVFIILLVVGMQMGELEWSHVGVCLAVAVVVLVTVAALRWHPSVFFSVLAAMDIVLVIFKGDIRIG